jgi:hypothetical protein
VTPVRRTTVALGCGVLWITTCSPRGDEPATVAPRAPISTATHAPTRAAWRVTLDPETGEPTPGELDDADEAARPGNAGALVDEPPHGMDAAQGVQKS